MIINQTREALIVKNVKLIAVSENTRNTYRIIIIIIITLVQFTMHFLLALVQIILYYNQQHNSRLCTTSATVHVYVKTSTDYKYNTVDIQARQLHVELALVC